MRKKGQPRHACPWCGAVLPNAILGQHIRDWHDKKFQGQNKMTPEQQMSFKANHYKYESDDPIAKAEKKNAEMKINKKTKMRRDVAAAAEIAKKWNESHPLHGEGSRQQ